jgi:predicted PurR-regulated permease PerM
VVVAARIVVQERAELGVCKEIAMAEDGSGRRRLNRGARPAVAVVADDPGEAEPTERAASVVVHELPASQVARAGLVLFGLGLGIYLLWRVQEVLFLLFLAILPATTIEPIVDRLRRGPLSRGTGVLAVYSVIVLALGLPAVLLAPSLIAQAGAFTDNLPARLEALRPFAERLQPLPLHNIVVNVLDQAVTQLQRPSSPNGEVIVAAGASVAVVVIDFLLVFVLAFYWLMERNALKRILLRAVPRHRVKDVNTVWNELEDTLGAWVRGQLFLMLIVGVVGGIGFVLLGLPSPIVLALIAALGEMIPIVGPYLAFTPAVLITLATQPDRVLLVLVFAIVVQLVESNVLVPRTMNHLVGISPLTIILGIQVGAILYGLPGALLAVPVAAAVQVILAHTMGADNLAPSPAALNAATKSEKVVATGRPSKG